jgi:hypothetical protein
MMNSFSKQSCRTVTENCFQSGNFNEIIHWRNVSIKFLENQEFHPSQHVKDYHIYWICRLPFPLVPTNTHFCAYNHYIKSIFLNRSEEEGEDEVDSDFSIEENDEPVSDQDDDEPKKKRRIITKAYKVY